LICCCADVIRYADIADATYGCHCRQRYAATTPRGIASAILLLRCYDIMMLAVIVCYAARHAMRVIVDVY